MKTRHINEIECVSFYILPQILFLLKTLFVCMYMCLIKALSARAAGKDSGLKLGRVTFFSLFLFDEFGSSVFIAPMVLPSKIFRPPVPLRRLANLAHCLTWLWHCTKLSKSRYPWEHIAETPLCRFRPFPRLLHGLSRAIVPVERHF